MTNTQTVFWKHVDIKNQDECWEWKFTKTKFGYGRLRFQNRLWLAHRLAFIFTYKNNIENKLVLHKCDNPSCCNPLHLFLGTYEDNNKDRVIKGRSCNVNGENNPNSKLTQSIVNDIRRLYSSNCYTQNELSIKFGVVENHIWNIIHNKSWKYYEVKT